MTFTIKLYKMSCEKNRLNKSDFLDDEIIFDDCILKEGTSIVNPTINLRVVDRVPTPRPIITSNYCYIEEFGRYYFIKNISSLYSGLWQLDLEIDVLMTYKDQIKTNVAIVSRNEFDFNNYIVDNKIAYKSNPIIEQIEVDNDLFYAPVEYVAGQPRDNDQHVYKVILSVFGGDYTSVNQG